MPDVAEPEALATGPFIVRGLTVAANRERQQALLEALQAVERGLDEMRGIGGYATELRRLIPDVLVVLQEAMGHGRR